MSLSSKKNIGLGHDDDPFYRYKRDTIQTFYDNANGITTHLVNIEIIAKQIKAPVESLCKYLQKNMGLNKFNNGKVQGRLLPDQVEKSIDKFIEKYLICVKCKVPEWDYNDKRCKGCGYYEKIDIQPATPIEEKRTDDETKMDIEMAGYLNRLYERRDRLLRVRKRLTNVDSYIDRCWRCDTKSKWDSLRSKIVVYLT
jgi:translation initiation factor 2 beta subunit (eIF-2beta)/eIF-5